jgi:hypothetical protein
MKEQGCLEQRGRGCLFRFPQVPVCGVMGKATAGGGDARPAPETCGTTSTALSGDQMPHRLQAVSRESRDGISERRVLQQVEQRAQERAVVVNARDHKVIAFMEQRDESEGEGLGRRSDAKARGGTA